ncbi:hypothetical protein AVEN_258041-1 [Araneus ventricosus]|uniref:Uncharacterized protein n=1 Tax=Araneus ventricosus TaxID=182803 RepID=A0A4Y2AHC7_ARAVE|nr:hypothetical protein AVEN_258041-1 [Araneus ventricosus]
MHCTSCRRKRMGRHGHRQQVVRRYADTDGKEGCGKVAISLSIGCSRKHFRGNRFGNHCRKVYIGKLLYELPHQQATKFERQVRESIFAQTVSETIPAKLT